MSYGLTPCCVLGYKSLTQFLNDLLAAQQMEKQVA